MNTRPPPPPIQTLIYWLRGKIEVRILFFRLLLLSYLLCDFDRVCDRMQGSIRACFIDSLAFYVAPAQEKNIKMQKGMSSAWLSTVRCTLVADMHIIAIWTQTRLLPWEESDLASMLKNEESKQTAFSWENTGRTNTSDLKLRLKHFFLFLNKTYVYSNAIFSQHPYSHGKPLF